MYQDDLSFENEVRRIALARWPQSSGGAIMVDGRERDGVFVAEEIVHAIECTTSPRLDKAKIDCKKLADLIKHLRKAFPYKGVKGWFITLNEPSAEQRTEAKKYGTDINACSFATFCSALVDSHDYLMLRNRYPFGSAVDPVTNTSDLGSHEYINVDLYSSSDIREGSVNDLVEDFEKKTYRVVLLGDFGAGKSMALRETFLRLEKSYREGRANRFPLHLNLRDHQGQTDPAEAILRHAVKIGFPKPDQLIRGWRAGFVNLLLDGFDEVATSGWAALNKNLTAIRHSNMALLRNFVKETPSISSIAIAGRLHYFNSRTELRKALGTSFGFSEVSLGDFTEVQAKRFIKSRKLDGKIPSWLPHRPLLISYLLQSKLLGDDVVSQISEAEGWNYLLERISEREARIESGLDGSTIRQIVERLATIARSKGDGLGRFTREALVQAFTDVCGYSPEIGSDVVLLRLPGVGNSSGDDGTRSFIDEGFADVASAGDVARYILNPFDSSSSPILKVQRGLGGLGASVAALQLRNLEVKAGKLRIAIEKAPASESDANSLRIDIFRVAQSLDFSLEGKSILIESSYCEGLAFDDECPDYSSLTFSNCILSTLSLERNCAANHLPTFANCYIGLLQGRSSQDDLPVEKFWECEIEEYSASVGTTVSILSMNVPLGVRALFTVLEKLFLQPGKGRQEGAFYRGLDHRTKELIPAVLHEIKSAHIAELYKIQGHDVWIPDRRQSARVKAILASPSSAEDPLVKKCEAIA